jgi:FixJ family two-component response regulator
MVQSNAPANQDTDRSARSVESKERPVVITAVVYVVDDDQDVLWLLQQLVESIGLEASTHTSAQSFLAAYDDTRPGCLVLDVRMPDMSGLALQKQLAQDGIGLPILMITGYADVPIALEAMKRGAFDFLEKPFSHQILLERIRQAIEQNKKVRKVSSEHGVIEDRIGNLTRRELQVMELVVSGKPNKIISAILGLSQKTVEVHRAHVMRKMKADSLPHLVQMVMQVRGPSTHPEGALEAGQ